MDEKEKQIKRELLQASHKAGACHLGSALSCVSILVDLFYTKKIDPKDFLFGKASGVAAYYTVLADLGYFGKDYVADYLKNYPLPSTEVPGITHSFGSVGHALSVAVGMALKDRERDIYVLLSDGDCQEGSTLEAALFANKHNLTNLHVLVDNNRFVACGYTPDILEMKPVWDFLRACLPNLEVVDTVKGDGISFMENNYEWHYKNLTDDLLEVALKEL